MYRNDAIGIDDYDLTSMKHPSSVFILEVAMALFGMFWLLRVRSEMRRCSKCRRDEMANNQHQSGHHQHFQQDNSCRRLSQGASLLHTPDDGITMSSANTLFTLDTPGTTAPSGYCEVHGYITPKKDIQEFYELTLLDESKSVQQKTVETMRIADKWEASDGPITPTFTSNDGGPASAFPLTQTLLNIYDYNRAGSPDAPLDQNQKTSYTTINVEEQLPPPPSPPQIKEAIQLDGISRPNSAERTIHPDVSQYIVSNHDTHKSHDSWQGHDGDQDHMEYKTGEGYMRFKPTSETRLKLYRQHHHQIGPPEKRKS